MTIERGSKSPGRFRIQAELLENRRVSLGFFFFWGGWAFEFSWVPAFLLPDPWRQELFNGGYLGSYQNCA
jgi:hypothetical protein